MWEAWVYGCLGLGRQFPNNKKSEKGLVVVYRAMADVKLGKAVLFGKHFLVAHSPVCPLTTAAYLRRESERLLVLRADAHAARTVRPSLGRRARQPA